MRRLNLVLLAVLGLCDARVPSFSIHDDLLAFPQFDVVFSGGFISDQDADALLESRASHPTYSADFSQPTVAEAGGHVGTEAEPRDAADAPTSYSYEVMNMPPHRYLCSIPAIRPPPAENQTANELAKAEEARELSRAATKGWELLAQLQDSCLYFMSGWWSYSFCNNREIVQFHALAASPNGQPPRRDPHTAEFVLGRVPTVPATAAAERHPARRDAPPAAAATPPTAELQIKGEQRYMVQRLEGGTICDLTGRERTVEVQYHCAPGIKEDRIGWIKEVTICAYVMVVNSPRLCNDVVFLPPEETKANPITCQRIGPGGGPDEGGPPLLDEKAPLVPDEEASAAAEPEAAAAESASAAAEGDAAKAEVTVGGVVIGARHVLSAADEDGKPPVKLAPPRGFWTGNRAEGDSLIEVLVRAASKEDGGRIKMPSAEELERMDIDPEVVQEMKDKMAKMAGDAGWKLEIVELDGGDLRELRGTIDRDDPDHTAAATAAAAQAEQTKQPAEAEAGQRDKEGGEGSEEKFFKEEL